MTEFISRHSRLIHIIAAMLIASMLFIAVQPGIVRAYASEENLSLTVAGEGVPVDTEVDEDGFRQIKYTFNGRDIEITDNDFTNSDPETDGEYITWMSQIEGKWQIFYYHVTTGSTIQLTHMGNNVNPVISENKVAWEGQVGGVWQIFVFDGIRVKQITKGDLPSLSVDIDDNILSYLTKESEETGWKVLMYDISTGKETLLTPDAYGSEPFLDDGRVKWTELIDGEPIRQSHQYKILPEVGVISSIPLGASAGSDDYTGVGDSFPETEIVGEDTEVTEKTEETVEEVVESTESTESEEVLGDKDTDQPEEVTVEDIKEELGLSDENKDEETTEQTSDSISEEEVPEVVEEGEEAVLVEEEIVEETEEVVESTESN